MRSSLSRPGRLGHRAQRVAHPLGRVEPAGGQPRVALDDVAGDQRVLEVERGDVALRVEHLLAQPAGAVGAVVLPGVGLDPGVLDDRRQVDLRDVGRPVDAPRVEVERRPVGRRRGRPRSPSGCRPGRSPRTRCRGRTARRTRAPARPRSAWSRACADSSACLPRSGSACSTFSPRAITVLARVELALHAAAAGEAATRGRRSAGPRRRTAGARVNQPLTLSTSVRYFSGLMPPDATWVIGGASSGPSAATAMIAATTRSTGITSTVPSGTPGNSLQQAAGVGDDHRLGHAEAADPARLRLGERRLDDRRAHDADRHVALRRRSAPARRAPW